MLPDDPEDLDPGLARERTRLAWTRTALAFAAVGLAVLRKDSVIGVIALAMAPLIWPLGRLATRTERPELLSRRLLLVTVTVTIVSLLAFAAAVLGQSPASLDQLLPVHG